MRGDLKAARRIVLAVTLASVVATPSTPVAALRGATEAAPGQFPAVAALLEDGELLCGAAVISPEWVLTAARCVVESWTVGAPPLVSIPVNRAYTVVAGEFDRQVDEGTEQRRIVDAIFLQPHPPLHRDWLNPDPKTMVNISFVALLHLDRPLEFNGSVGSLPIGVPELDTRATVAGWGNTSGGPDGTSSDRLRFYSPIIDLRAGITFVEAIGARDDSGATPPARPCAKDAGDPLISPSGGVISITGVADVGDCTTDSAAFFATLRVPWLNGFVRRTGFDGLTVGFTSTNGGSDTSQCGRMGWEQQSLSDLWPLGNPTNMIRIDTDNRIGGCELRLGIGNDSGWLNSPVRARWQPNGRADAGQCAHAGEGQIPTTEGDYLVIGLDTDDRRGWCDLTFTVDDPTAALDVQFLADGDPGQCRGAVAVGEYLTATSGNPVTIGIDTDHRPGGCRLSLRLRGGLTAPPPPTPQLSLTCAAGYQQYSCDARIDNDIQAAYVPSWDGTGIAPGAAGWHVDGTCLAGQAVGVRIQATRLTGQVLEQTTGFLCPRDRDPLP